MTLYTRSIGRLSVSEDKNLAVTEETEETEETEATEEVSTQRKSVSAAKNMTVPEENGN